MFLKQYDRGVQVEVWAPNMELRRRSHRFILILLRYEKDSSFLVSKCVILTNYWI
jgi:hypothetical protein